MDPYKLVHSVDRPLVTIAIPTYNRAQWLRSCILAALEQSYENFEVVVFDNASTDETAEVLSEFRDPRLRVYTQHSKVDLPVNWNACLAEARGEYIVFVSDDDRLAPWFIERCMSLVKNEPKLPVVISLSDVHFTAENRIYRAPINRTLRTGVWDGAEILKEYFSGRISAQMCGILVRTESLRDEGGFRQDLPYQDDLACWALILIKGK
jgi:glycosyltransferase involved in cell wall biosynthesis